MGGGDGYASGASALGERGSEWLGSSACSNISLITRACPERTHAFPPRVEPPQPCADLLKLIGLVRGPIMTYVVTENCIRCKYTDCVEDRKSTRLNSSHLVISYAVFCLKKKKIHIDSQRQELWSDARV